MIRFGPFKRKDRPGVPADHFVPFKDASRFARFDHHGRVTTLVAEGGAAGNLDVADPATFEWSEELSRTFASAAMMGGSEQDYRSQIEQDVALLNGGTGTAVETASWYGLRDQVYGVLAWALSVLGVADDELPELVDMDRVRANDYSYAQATDDHELALHQGKAVTHTHSHSTYGKQGGDKTHSHQHSHNGDANHNHHGSASKASSTESVTRITGPEHLAAKIAELRSRQAETAEVERLSVKVLTASGEAALAVELPIRWDDEAWDAAWYDKETKTYGRKGAFVSTLTAAGADMPELVDDPGGAWQSYLCIEGVRTDEGYFSRELMPDCIQFPDLPVSMRLQIEDEGGHYGAVTCGRIDTMERVPYPEDEALSAIAATGVFGTDENGQVAQLLVEEQTQRFVSVDLRDMESEIVEVAISVNVSGGMYDDDDDDCDGVYDWWMRVTSAVIGGATIVAMPALQQAVIVMAGVDLPTAPLALERAPATAVTVTASGNPDLLKAPPEAWFADPQFHVGDQRLVRQPDGHTACPLTITEDGQVYGHAAYWGSEHTGVRNPKTGRGVTPPHSPTYAYFMTGSRTTAEGTKVSIGNITMGCGHATIDKNMRQTAAHYDGGYGAVQVCDVRVGEDDFGIWFAGALCEPWSEANPDGPTDEQVRQFQSMGLSGDWRGVAGSDEPHFTACLAVPVPGFPIVRESLVASAAITEAIADGQLTTFRTDAEGGVMALVAAGRVRRMSPDERLDQFQALLELLLGERRQRRQAEVLSRLGDL